MFRETQPAEPKSQIRVNKVQRASCVAEKATSKSANSNTEEN